MTTDKLKALQTSRPRSLAAKQRIAAENAAAEAKFGPSAFGPRAGDKVTRSEAAKAKKATVSDIFASWSRL